MKSPTGDFHTQFQQTTPPPHVPIGIWAQPALPVCHVGVSAYPHTPYPTYCPTPLFPRCLRVGVLAHKDIPCAIHCPGLRFLHCQHVGTLPHNFISVRTMDTTWNEFSSVRQHIHNSYIRITKGNRVKTCMSWRANTPTHQCTDTQIFHDCIFIGTGFCTVGMSAHYHITLSHWELWTLL